MNRQCDWERRCATGIQASTMGLIRPTDIMLGRGPTCYNNPGNRVLRKLIKENVGHYKNETRRREKAALVKLLVSTLDAKGYRFFHRSSTGTWIEVPPHIAEKKVGHGLRDARLSVAKLEGGVNVLPKNFRPAIPEKSTKSRSRQSQVRSRTQRKSSRFPWNLNAMLLEQTCRQVSSM